MRSSERDPTSKTLLPVTTTLKDAVPVVASTDKPVRATKGGRVVGVVDRVAVLRAMAEPGG